MQYLLEALELSTHFSIVVRHLGGETRKLILNLPPQKAFEELRAEYSDTKGSLDPLAFYERSQKSGESTCSYTIALEAKLRAVEENQRGDGLIKMVSSPGIS